MTGSTDGPSAADAPPAAAFGKPRGSTLDPVAMPPNTTGFGAAEVVYLLSRQPGEVARRSYQVLRLPAGFTGEDVTVSGASSLVARGLAELVGLDRVETRGDAALLEYALAATVQWIGLELAYEGRGDTVFVLQSRELAGILQPRGLGTWFASFTPGVDKVPELIDALLAGPHGAISVRVSVGRLDGPATTCVLRRGEDAWSLEAAGAPERVPVRAIAARLRELIPAVE